MKKNKLTKMQRQVRSERKTWTNAQRFYNTIKNRMRLGKIESAAKAQMKAMQLIQQAAEEQAAEGQTPVHIHDESCTHEEAQDV